MLRALAGAARRRFAGGEMEPANPARPSSVPEGMRVYAIGDIHGRLDLLRSLREQILLDWTSSPAAQGVVVFLGDYVDRGPDSRGVIESLLADRLEDLQTVHLLGNHEQLLLQFLAGGEHETWMVNCGYSTMSSYGVDDRAIALGDTAAMRESFRQLLPQAHLDFLSSLKAMHFLGDYCFVHAGVRPGVPLARQKEAEVIWIRKLFLESEEDFGKIVVHGHSIAPEVAWRPNRIGIDTGAYYSDQLTCLVLEGTERRILQT